MNQKTRDEANAKGRLFNEGDVLYRVIYNRKTGQSAINRVTVIKVKDYHTHFVYETDEHMSLFNWSQNYYKTEEEAKIALQQIKSKEEKRKLLKQYEAKLNIELGLSDYIVK